MSETSIDFTTIDFDELKQELIDYISAQSEFTSMNFEGSNLNLLINLLAYITNILSYNLNQSINEVYLGTAQLRSNVLKIVKLLNYTPARAYSSKITLDLSNITTKVQPAHPLGTSSYLLKYDKVASGGYNFYYVGDNIEIVSTFINDVEFKEGTLVNDPTGMTGDNTNFQEFIIEDTNIGDYLVVFTVDQVTGDRTYWSQFAEGTVYPSPEDVYIYFIEEVENGYKIYFGNAQLGRRPAVGEVIGYEYIQPSGAVANDLSDFTWSGGGEDETRNADYDQKVIDTVTLTLDSSNTASYAATIKESIEDIKFNAPKFFQTQGRAVTAEDYYALAINHVWIEKAFIIGGQDLTPMELGYVYIRVKPDSNSYPTINFTTADLSTLRDHFLEYSVVTINPVVENPQYIYVVLDITLRYTADSAPSISDTEAVIDTFINTTNSEFGDYLEYSKLLTQIDSGDTLTTSNLTDMELYALLESEHEVSYGHYEIQVAKNLNSAYVTRIEQYNFDTLVHTYTEDVDYTAIYDTAESGDVEIDFETGDGLDMTDDIDSEIAIISVHGKEATGDNDIWYIAGDLKTTGTVTDEADLSTGGEERIYYGTTIDTEIVVGRLCIMTSGLQENHVFRIVQIGADTGSENWFDIEPISIGADDNVIYKNDTFAIRLSLTDIDSTPYNLGDGENIRVEGINASFEGFYKLITLGAIHTDPVYGDDIWVETDVTYNTMPEYTLASLSFTDAYIHTSPQFYYRFYFGTEDEDVFLNKQQIFTIIDGDLDVDVEKVSV